MARFKLIKGSRLSKYLIYAIGEIILVVIGILIALYINDVQKERAYEASEQQLLKDVYAQLIKDSADISKFIEKVEQRNLDYSYFKDERPEDAKMPAFFKLSRAPLKIDPVVENSIAGFDFKRSAISLKLSTLLTNYRYAQQNIAQLESEMNAIYTGFIKHLSSTYDWYVEYSFENHINSEATAYFYNNKEYKRFISSINSIASKEYIYELKSLRELMRLEMSAIKVLIE